MVLYRGRGESRFKGILDNVLTILNREGNRYVEGYHGTVS